MEKLIKIDFLLLIKHVHRKRFVKKKKSPIVSIINGSPRNVVSRKKELNIGKVSNFAILISIQRQKNFISFL